MSRPWRIEFKGALYHVLSRGNEQNDIFWDDIETGLSPEGSLSTKTFMQLSSLQGSILENRIFEDDFQVESISTAKLFGILNTVMARIYFIRENEEDEKKP